MNNDINIASRAGLYSSLNKSYSSFQKDLMDIHNLHNSLPQEIIAKYKIIIGKQYLYNIFSTMEILLVDSAVNLLISYPGKIGNLKNDTDLLTEVSTLTGAIRYHAIKRINELSYKKPSEFIKEVYDMFGEKPGIGEDVFGKIIEGKATRDLYMHNNGKSNYVYFEKSGKYARVKNDEEFLVLDEQYLADLKVAVEQLGNDFKTKCIEKHINDTPIMIFKKMWEMSALNRIVEFERQWIIKGRYVFISDLTWDWSGSEKALFNFFKFIHGGKADGLNISDIPYALYRWKGQVD